MKNVIKNAIFAILLTAGVAAHANERINVKVNEGLTLEVVFAEKGTLKLEDQKGEILYKEVSINEKSHNKMISLAEIPDGTYFLEFEKEDSIVTSVINKKAGEINIVDEAIVFKPVYEVKEKAVKFLLTNPMEKKATLKVYDTNGNLVGESVNSDFVFKKTLDFSKMPAGEYTVSLRIGENNFLKTVSL